MTKKADPKWILKETILSIQSILISEHGGTSGIRDEGLLDSALARPKNLHLYSETANIFELASSLGYSLIKNNPFIDGNKRVALTATAVFLDINGWILNASEPEAVIVFTDLASNKLTEKEFVVWLKKNSMKNI